MLVRKENKIVRQEGIVFGDADEGIANNIEIVIRNDSSLYERMKAVVNSLVKKVSRGIELDKEKLMHSSVVDQLVRDTIRFLQKEDQEGDNEGLFDHISTETRNLAKQLVAETILNKVEDTIRFNTYNKYN